MNFTYPLYVNLDILKEAGVEEILKTWSELTEATSEITKSTGMQDRLFHFPQNLQVYRFVLCMFSYCEIKNRSYVFYLKKLLF
ncbi:hypothetical protein CJ195_18230 [Bacillus sp. UMB0899]|nr:hypothetical protein CJ195_18230 [Bacillus sp. UMB0899]